MESANVEPTRNEMCRIRVVRSRHSVKDRLDETFLMKETCTMSGLRKVLLRKDYMSHDDDLMLCNDFPWSVRGVSSEKNKGFSILEQWDDTPLCIIYAMSKHSAPADMLKKHVQSYIGVRIWNEADRDVIRAKQAGGKAKQARQTSGKKEINKDSKNKDEEGSGEKKQRKPRAPSIKAQDHVQVGDIFTWKSGTNDDNAQTYFGGVIRLTPSSIFYTLLPIENGAPVTTLVMFPGDEVLEEVGPKRITLDADGNPQFKTDDKLGKTLVYAQKWVPI